MKLVLGVAAENRNFGKVARRAVRVFDSLKAAFEQQTLTSPIHETLVVGLTDGMPANSIREIPNSEGVFQVMCGLGSWTGQQEDLTLERKMFGAVKRAIESAPFTAVDRAALTSLAMVWVERELAA